jgi:metal-responsive CopG/Arc/MetJ family transcriptional regulator
MTSLSIKLPDTIAKASNEAAKSLGMSRTEFIRQAIVHELDSFKTKVGETEIIKSFAAMKKSKEYLKEAENITETLFSELPKEEDEWWNKPKH